jgi:hypothetical protein
MGNSKPRPSAGLAHEKERRRSAILAVAVALLVVAAQGSQLSARGGGCGTVQP